ncbi:MAG TPA: hypothetical protein VN688_07540 [Gemmataceae bacterium]|nr:hypothetical protein [Gemmataceae bacterium]
MDFSLDPKQDETRIAERQLYRAGQTKPDAKPALKPVSKAGTKPALPVPPPKIAKSSLAKSKSSLPGKDGKNARWKRIGLGLLILLGFVALGGVAYCIFRPDPVEEAKHDLAAIRNDPNMDGKAKWEKTREIFSNLTERQKMDMFKEGREKDRERTSAFFKLSKEEQIAKIKNDILEGEKRRAKRDAERAARGGGSRQGSGGPGGGRAGGAGGAGGAGAGGRGGADGAAGGGAGGRGGPGGQAVAGQPGGGGPGGPGGSRGDSHQRQKNRLDFSDPEYRAQKSQMRAMQSQVRQQMGLPPGGGRGGFGGGPRGPR